MITAIVTTDLNNHHLFEMTQIMLSPMTNSYWFVRGICEGSNIVTDYDTWRKMSKLEEIPSNVPVFINVNPVQISKKFQLTPVTIISNTLAVTHLPDVDRIIHVKYRDPLSKTNLKSTTQFPFPDVEKNTLAVLPHFDLIEYVVKEANYDVDLSS